MEKYRFIDDLTSDVMFEASGRNLAELFNHCAQALFSVICDIEKIHPVKPMPVSVSAADEESLLYEWLSTLLTQSEINGLFLSRFDITRLETGDTCLVTATAYGETLSPEKGDTVVKGIAYYGFQLKKTADGYRARVAMDI